MSKSQQPSPGDTKAALPPAACSARFTPRYFRLVTQAAKHYRRSFHTHCSNRRFKHWIREERKCKAKAQREFWKRNVMADLKRIIYGIDCMLAAEPNRLAEQRGQETNGGANE